MLAAAALLLAFFLWHRADKHADIASAATAGHGAINVESTRAGHADIPIYMDGLGTVQAFYTVTITARVDGQLDKLDFVEGQKVKKGDLLAQIDPRPYQASLDQAIAIKLKDETLLENAKRDLERYLTLAPQDLASKQTVDTQRSLVGQLTAQVKVDQAVIDNAKAQLDYTRITSPIDGRTGIRMIDPGNNVRASDTTGIVVVTQTQPISVIFTLPEESFLPVEKALTAGSVAVAALSRDGETELDRGTLSLMDNQIDQTTGMIRLKATFDNKNSTLWPGEFINARVLLRTEQHALTIPSAAVLRGANGTFTYVIKLDSSVEVRPLKVGVDNGAVAVIESGLKEGEQVVTSNQFRLRPGAEVNAAEQGASAAAHKTKKGSAT
jgi:multidrug efflux system membrane fusion protein